MLQQPKKLSPPEPASLTKFDWNFDAVPDNELVACCYWEYARESAFIPGREATVLRSALNGVRPVIPAWRSWR